MALFKTVPIFNYVFPRVKRALMILVRLGDTTIRTAKVSKFSAIAGEFTTLPRQGQADLYGTNYRFKRYRFLYLPVSKQTQQFT